MNDTLWASRPRQTTAGLAAHVAGHGPVVVLLHGVGLRAEAWSPVIDALSSRFTVIAPDMPGHGQSVVRPDIATLSAYSAAMVDLWEGPAVLAGHSMGAMIALDIAARWPAKVAGVAALNAIFERAPAAKVAVAARAASLDGRSVADPEATLRRWFGDAPSAARDACRTWLTDVDPQGYKAAYSVFAQEDGPSRAALAALTCQALFMTGAEEPNSTPAMSQAMAALAPMGEARVVADAAHMMPMTHADIVADTLNAFALRALV